MFHWYSKKQLLDMVKQFNLHYHIKTTNIKKSDLITEMNKHLMFNEKNEIVNRNNFKYTRGNETIGDMIEIIKATQVVKLLNTMKKIMKQRKQKINNFDDYMDIAINHPDVFKHNKIFMMCERYKITIEDLFYSL